MTVTMKKVARRAGVSVSTVSRVLSGHANVREETSRKVRQTMEELGYTPNIIAQNLVSRSTRCVCVLLPDTAEIWPANLYCMEVIRGIVLGAGKLGYDIQIASGDGERGELESVSRLLKGGRADGAILLSARRSSSVVNFLQQEGYPFVLVEDEPAADGRSEGTADQHETDAGSAGQTKVGGESAGGERYSLVGDGASASVGKPGWKIADSRSSSLVENGRGEAGDGSKVEADLQETNAGSAGQTKVSGESAGGESNNLVGAGWSVSEVIADMRTAGEGASQASCGRESAGGGCSRLAAVFTDIPDESVAQMGAMASELLIGSIRRQHQQSPGGNAGWMAQFVLRRPVLRG